MAGKDRYFGFKADAPLASRLIAEAEARVGPFDPKRRDNGYSDVVRDAVVAYLTGKAPARCPEPKVHYLGTLLAHHSAAAVKAAVQTAEAVDGATRSSKGRNSRRNGGRKDSRAGGTK